MPTPHSRPGHRLRRREQGSKSASTRSRHVLRPGLDLGRLVVMAEDPPVEARDRDVDARRAEVRDEHVAGVRAERQLARRPAARAGSDLALGDQPAIDQLADALRDDGPPEARPRDQFGPRSRATEPDLVEDHDQGVEGLVREWPRGPAAPCRHR